MKNIVLAILAVGSMYIAVTDNQKFGESWENTLLVIISLATTIATFIV